MFCLYLLEEYGGMGVDFFYSVVVIEEIGWVGLIGIGFFLYLDIVVFYIFYYGSEVLKCKYLLKLVFGEMVVVIVMIELGVGFDL